MLRLFGITAGEQLKIGLLISFFFSQPYVEMLQSKVKKTISDKKCSGIRILKYLIQCN